MKTLQELKEEFEKNKMVLYKAVLPKTKDYGKLTTDQLPKPKRETTLSYKAAIRRQKNMARSLGVSLILTKTKNNGN